MDAGHRTHGTGTWARRERTVNNQMKGVCTVITNMSLYSPDKDQDLWTYGSVLSRESHTDLDTGKHEHNLCNIGGATLSLICDCALHKQVMLINRRVLVAHLCCPSRDPCREVPPPPWSCQGRSGPSYHGTEIRTTTRSHSLGDFTLPSWYRLGGCRP